MKKNRLIALIMSCVCVFLLVVPSFAAEARASAQIKLYWMDVTTSPGNIIIQFSITGHTTMKKIGCESIQIDAKWGDSWIPVQSLDEDDEGMSRAGVAHKNTIYCPGSAGWEYRVVVTLFAENDAGRDTRTQTFYVTGK